MKKIGIVADNYKLPTFRRELTAAGFQFEEKSFTQSTTALFVTTDRVEELGALCKKVQVACWHQKASEN